MVRLDDLLSGAVEELEGRVGAVRIDVGGGELAVSYSKVWTARS